MPWIVSTSQMYNAGFAIPYHVPLALVTVPSSSAGREISGPKLALLAQSVDMTRWCWSRLTLWHLKWLWCSDILAAAASIVELGQFGDISPFFSKYLPTQYCQWTEFEQMDGTVIAPLLWKQHAESRHTSMIWSAQWYCVELMTVAHVFHWALMDMQYLIMSSPEAQAGPC